MTRYTPLWQQGGSYAASLDRALMQSLFVANPPGFNTGQVRGGFIAGLVTAVSNTMNLNVNAVYAAVPLGTTFGSLGTALCMWDATEVVTVTAAPPSGQSRLDLVVITVRDPVIDAGANNDFIFQVVAGAPTTGTPAAPAVPANSLAVFQVLVPGAVANLNTATLTDLRRGMGPPAVWPGQNALPAGTNPRGALAVAVDTTDDSLMMATSTTGAPPWTWTPIASRQHMDQTSAWQIATLNGNFANFGAGYQPCCIRVVGPPGRQRAEFEGMILANIAPGQSQQIALISGYTPAYNSPPILCAGSSVPSGAPNGIHDVRATSAGSLAWFGTVAGAAMAAGGWFGIKGSWPLGTTV